MPEQPKPTFFASPEAFRKWMTRHHASLDELWVGFYKKGSGRPSITWPESVDVALCFGWIDGLRKSLDGESYVIRFTPRRSGSVWSAVNTRRAEELIRAGLMQPAGLRAFEGRDPEKTRRYSFEQGTNTRFSKADEAKFRASKEAWRFFESQPPGYRRTATWWVVSAKRDATRENRLQTLIRDSAAGERIAPLRRDENRTRETPSATKTRRRR